MLKVTDPTLVDDDGQQQRVAWQDMQVFAPTPAEMPQPAQLHDIIRLHRIQARGGQRLPLRLPAARAAALPAARAAVQGRGQRIAGSLTRAARGAQVQELLQGIAQGVSRARAQVQELHQGIAQGVARARRAGAGVQRQGAVRVQPQPLVRVLPVQREPAGAAPAHARPAPRTPRPGTCVPRPGAAARRARCLGRPPSTARAPQGSLEPYQHSGTGFSGVPATEAAVQASLRTFGAQLRTGPSSPGLGPGGNPNQYQRAIQTAQPGTAFDLTCKARHAAGRAAARAPQALLSPLAAAGAERPPADCQLG